MKKIFFALLALMCLNTAVAQRDTLVTGTGMSMMRSNGSGELLFEMGGYAVTLNGRSASTDWRAADRKPKAFQWGLGFGRIELGFSLLTSPDYDRYTPEQKDFLDLKVGKSIHFGFRFFNVGVALNKNRTWFFRTGLHLMCDNYTFSDNHTLQRVEGQIVPVGLDKDYKKSKLMTASLGIPVQFTFTAARKLNISLLAYGDLVFNSHTKYKKPKHKAHLSGVNEWQAGVGATISYRGFGVYAKYGLTPMFRSGVGPKTHPITVGLYFGR